MATLDELNAALIKADAAGNSADAKVFADEIRKMRAAPAVKAPETSIMQDIGQGAGNLAAGAVRGATSIGTTILWPFLKARDKIKGDREPTLSGLITGKQPLSRYEEMKMQIDQGLQEMGAEPDSMLYKGGKIGTEIAGTMGVGGALGKVAAKVAPSLPIISNALASGGFNLGSAANTGAGFLPWLQNMGARVAGGAVTGGVSAGMVDPQNTTTGAVIGGALPPAARTAMAGGRYVGNLASSLARPFTESGQDKIVGSIFNKAMEGGPSAINAREIIPGSLPTLAESMGNANIAGLQRVARDIRPQAFVDREAANSLARNSLFDRTAGSQAALDAAKNTRSAQAGVFYDQAMQKGFDPAALTPQTLKEISDLMKRPAMQSAAGKAKEMALNAGLKVDKSGSMQGLHYTKMALDDQVGEAIRRGSNTEAKILLGVKDKLAGVLDDVSPDYMQGSRTFAELSKPVNQMEVLQNLRLTNSQGNITLAKVQNNIDNLQKIMREPGTNPAKSLTADQIGALQSIRDDLLRQQNINLGRSAGSNTFQNIATNNILQSALPGGLGQVAVNKAGPVLGQIGKLLYSGPNEAIQGKLANAFLNPAEAQRLISLAQQSALVDPNRYSGLLSNIAKPQPVIFGGLLDQ